MIVNDFVGRKDVYFYSLAYHLEELKNEGVDVEEYTGFLVVKKDGFIFEVYGLDGMPLSHTEVFRVL